MPICESRFSVDGLRMQLATELFRQVMDGMNSNTQTTSPHERRKEARVGVSCSLELTPQHVGGDARQAIRVKVRDISPSGMGFVTHRHMDAGSSLLCSLPRQGGVPVDVMMIVRHCTRIAADLYSVGVCFEKKIA
jgi:hypothetical protein